MPVNILRSALLYGLLFCASAIFGQADISVAVTIDRTEVSADQLVYATVFLTNEGDGPRSDLAIDIRLSEALFFVSNLSPSATFDQLKLRWTVKALAPGAKDSLRVSIQPNYGGIHTFIAELMLADKPDWDSEPGNGIAAEDDYAQACISVPVNLSCGQHIVLKAPKGFLSYTWFRDDKVLSYATSDTLHPGPTGAYRYVINKQSCASGNCCPVKLVRAACINDLALVMTASQINPTSQFQQVKITVYNEGAGAVSKLGLYVTTSKFMRLSTNASQQGWQLAGDRMLREWNGTLQPRDSITINFEIQAIAGGQAADYRLFAEISSFYAGTSLLKDADSQPDENPFNDKIVKNGRGLSAAVDEDDSDIADLINCAVTQIAGNQALCPGESLTLIATTTGSQSAKYEWSGAANISCTTCPNPTIKVDKASQLLLVVTSSGGCVQRTTVDVATKTCGSDMFMVVSPYGKSQECLPATASIQANWCPSNLSSTVTMADSRNSQGICISASSTGAWAGVGQPCLQLCESGNCVDVNIKLVVLPRRDEISPTAPGSICLSPVLQVNQAAVGARVLDNEGGLKLSPTGNNCYALLEPGSSYPSKTFTVIHEYLLAGIQVFDTTLVRIPAKKICALDVLAEEGFSILTDPTTNRLENGGVICLAGSFTQLSSLSYRVDGKMLTTPIAGCTPYEVAKFSLRDLPRGYQDNGWRIESYLVAGKSVLTNEYAATLNAVAERIQKLDPASAARISADRLVLEVESYSQIPGELRLRHLATNALIAVRPVVVNGFKGWKIVLPADLAIGTHQITATNSQGCADSAPLLVKAGVVTSVTRDTLNVEAELGEPYFLADLQGFTAPVTGSWTVLATGFVMTPTQLGTRSYLFSKSSAGIRAEKVLIQSVKPFACTALAKATQVVVDSRDCNSATVALGLTRPNLEVFASTGRILSNSQVTGSRAGAQYSLTPLSEKGLTTTYTVVEWPGLPKAIGKKGNLQQIIQSLRQNGVDVYIDWVTDKLYAGGSGMGTLKLSGGAGQILTLAPTSNQLSTYGSYYGRPGIATLSLKSATCQSSMSVNLKCEVMIPNPGGTIEILAGLEMVFPLTAFTLPDQTVSISPLEMPEPLDAQVGNGGDHITLTAAGGSFGDFKMVILACDKQQNCQPVEVNVKVGKQECTVDIWREETTSLIVGPGARQGELVLPKGYNPLTDQIEVDGKIVDSALELREVTVERSYSTTGSYSAVRTPFGKTVEVQQGNFADALKEVLTGTVTLDVEKELYVSDIWREEQVYVRDTNGDWKAIEPLREVKSERTLLFLSPGAHEVILHRKQGLQSTPCVDAVRVDVLQGQTELSNATIELTVGEEKQYCLPASRKGGVVVGIENDCVEKSGERVLTKWTDDCITLTAFEMGYERMCIRRIYLDGGVDSIQLSLRATAKTELVAVADRDTVEFGQFKVIEILANDKLTDEPRSVSLISEPYFGRAQIVGNQAVEYLHYGGDCATDVFTYEICQGDNCVSNTVELIVFCEDLLIYNGLSPNGDGVNEEFTIVGLGKYPKHSISIFNRAGNLLTVMTDYQSDWRGVIDGRPLPEGTYFYVVDLGNGDRRSGYLQLSL